MEHRTILGGEQWLPFARNCVARLKRLGIPYASQKYEIDGATIRVRITPDHEFIHLEGVGEKYLWVMMTLETQEFDNWPVGVNEGGGKIKKETLLYRLPAGDPTNASEAVRVHSGFGVQTRLANNKGADDEYTSVARSSPNALTNYDFSMADTWWEGHNIYGVYTQNVAPRTPAAVLQAATNPGYPADATPSIRKVWTTTRRVNRPDGETYQAGFVEIMWTYQWSYISKSGSYAMYYQNCIAGFAPKGKTAALWYSDSNADYPLKTHYEDPVLSGYGEYGGGTTTTSFIFRTRIVWGARESSHTYTLSRLQEAPYGTPISSITPVDTRTGDTASLPVFLSSGALYYRSSSDPYSANPNVLTNRILKADGTDTVEPATGYTWDATQGPVVAYLALGDAGYSETDPRNPYSPRARTRREVGWARQGYDFIQYVEYNDIVPSDSPVYSRTNEGGTHKTLKHGIFAHALDYNHYYNFSKTVSGEIEFHQQTGDVETAVKHGTLQLANLLSVVPQGGSAPNPDFAAGISRLPTHYIMRNGGPDPRWDIQQARVATDVWTPETRSCRLFVQVLPGQDSLFVRGNWFKPATPTPQP